VHVSLDRLLSLQGKTQKDLSALINKALYYLDEEDLIVLQTSGEPATALWMEPTYGPLAQKIPGCVKLFNRQGIPNSLAPKISKIGSVPFLACMDIFSH
jgi:transcription initiation factor IIE alpha subunit